MLGGGARQFQCPRKSSSLLLAAAATSGGLLALARDAGALGPLAAGVLLGEPLPARAELGRVVGLLVLRDAQPVEGLGTGVGSSVPPGHLVEPSPGSVELLAV